MPPHSGETQPTQHSALSPQHPSQQPALGTQHSLGLIIVAAGRGERFGGDKVWELLGGQPLVARSLAALAGPPVDCVALVVAPARLADGRALARMLTVPCVVVPGGARRQDSVRNGLLALGPCDWVAVHDAARPFATRDLLVRTLAAAQASGAAVPAVPITDTVKRVRDGLVVDTVPRADLWAVQTPQVFRAALLAQAHRTAVDDATDDATLVERLGTRVAVAEGAYNNVKITTPEDMALAAWRVRSAEC
jgi:2-C-methyl-D-erythritol 4-phosphate cytidylyltransferase